jgi:hypothetical protein
MTLMLNKYLIVKVKIHDNALSETKSVLINSHVLYLLLANFARRLARISGLSER